MNPIIYDFRNPKNWEERLICWLLFGMFNIDPDRIGPEDLPSTSCGLHGALVFRVMIVLTGSFGLFMLGGLIGTGFMAGEYPITSLLCSMMFGLLIWINSMLDVPWSEKFVAEVCRVLGRIVDVWRDMTSPVRNLFRPKTEKGSSRPIGNAIADAFSDVRHRMCRPITIVPGDRIVEVLQYGLNDWADSVGLRVDKVCRHEDGYSEPNRATVFMSVSMYQRVLQGITERGYDVSYRISLLEKALADDRVVRLYGSSMSKTFPDGSPVPMAGDEPDPNLFLFNATMRLGGMSLLLVTNHASVPSDGAVIRVSYRYDVDGEPVMENLPYPEFEMPLDISAITKVTS